MEQITGQVETFRQRRERQGLTQRQVAAAIGITDQTISNFERQGVSPVLSAGQFARLCELFGVTIQELAEMLEAEP